MQIVAGYDVGYYMLHVGLLRSQEGLRFCSSVTKCVHRHSDVFNYCTHMVVLLCHVATHSNKTI
jgi:hypothetical protein